MGNVRQNPTRSFVRESDHSGFDHKQGAKAQQRRERGKDAGKGGKSQLKINEQSKSIVCNTCRQSFVSRIVLVRRCGSHQICAFR